MRRPIRQRVPLRRPRLNNYVMPQLTDRGRHHPPGIQPMHYNARRYADALLTYTGLHVGFPTCSEYNSTPGSRRVGTSTFIIFKILQLKGRVKITGR